jgi:hypothetical protein
MSPTKSSSAFGLFRTRHRIASGFVLWYSRSVARVALGLAYLFPPLSSGGASLACPLLPVPYPPGHRRQLAAPGSHRTWRAALPHHALQQLVHSTASACSFL